MTLEVPDEGACNMNFDYEKRFEVGELKFRMRVYRDECMREPWEEHDGHGIVSDWTNRPKAPGELVLATDRQMHRFYDLAESIKIAKRDGWDTSERDESVEVTKAQKAYIAAMADYRRMKAWCDDEWWWVAVIVELLDIAGRLVPDHGNSLGGIESDCEEYHMEVANEMAEEIAAGLAGKNEVCVRIRK